MSLAVLQQLVILLKHDWNNLGHALKKSHHFIHYRFNFRRVFIHISLLLIKGQQTSNHDKDKEPEESVCEFMTQFLQTIVATCIMSKPLTVIILLSYG